MVVSTVIESLAHAVDYMIGRSCLGHALGSLGAVRSPVGGGLALDL